MWHFRTIHRIHSWIYFTNFFPIFLSIINNENENCYHGRVWWRQNKQIQSKVNLPTWLALDPSNQIQNGSPFRLNYFSRDTMNCYLSSTCWFFVMIFFTCWFFEIFLFSHFDFFAKKQHKNQKLRLIVWNKSILIPILDLCDRVMWIDARFVDIYTYLTYLPNITNLRGDLLQTLTRGGDSPPKAPQPARIPHQPENPPPNRKREKLKGEKFANSLRNPRK